MNILAIDPGTKCGWACGLYKSGVWNLKPSRHEGAGMRFVNFEKSFREVLNSGITLVGYEEVRRHIGTDAAHIYGGLVASIQRICEERGIPYTGVPVGTIKKHATGKGNADKQKMIGVAHQKFGIQIIDDNHADALWIWDYLVSEYACENNNTPIGNERS